MAGKYFETPGLKGGSIRWSFPFNSVPKYHQYIYKMTSRTERFQRKPREKDETEEEPEETISYFTAEEEAVYDLLSPCAQRPC